MKIRAFLFAVTFAAGVVGLAAPASADIRIYVPPNPFQPPDTPLVDKTAPPDVTVIFDVSPGPPNVTSPGTPGR